MICAGGGADRVSGGSGNDRIFGDAGGDVLSGGTGRDRISGSSGADRLLGRSGNDRLAGGSGQRPRPRRLGQRQREGRQRQRQRLRRQRQRHRHRRQRTRSHLRPTRARTALLGADIARDRLELRRPAATAPELTGSGARRGGAATRPAATAAQPPVASILRAHGVRISFGAPEGRASVHMEAHAVAVPDRPAPPPPSGARSGPRRGRSPPRSPRGLGKAGRRRRPVTSCPGPAAAAAEDHRPGLHLGERVVERAPASSRAMRGWAAIRLPSHRPRDGGHAPPAYRERQRVVSSSALAPATATIASAVPAPAKSRTAVRRKSTNLTRPGRRGLGEAAHAVDDEVGAVDDRLGPLVGAHADLDADSRSPRHEGVERVERVQVGHIVPAVERVRTGRASTRERMPSPLSTCTGGRISSTLRPQWMSSPASSRLVGHVGQPGLRGLLVGRAAPVEGLDRPLSSTRTRRTFRSGPPALGHEVGTFSCQEAKASIRRGAFPPAPGSRRRGSPRSRWPHAHQPAGLSHGAPGHAATRP